MNLDALVAAVNSKGFSFTPPTSGPTDPTNPILIELNAAYRQVNGAQRWPWLEKSMTLSATIANQQAYLLNTISDFRQLDAVRLTDNLGNKFDLTNMEPQQFKAATFEGTLTGRPTLWTQYSGAVQLYPIPDGTEYSIIIDYIFNPPDLAADADIPVLPAVYHDVLVWGAIQTLAFRERNIWAQELAMGYYNTRYKQMQQEYELMQRQTSSRVIRSGFNDSLDPWALIPGLGG